MINSRKLEDLHPKVKTLCEKFIASCDKQGIDVLITSTYRDGESQSALYAQGRTKLFDANGKRLGIVTKAKGGQSIHNYGMAIDIVLITGGAASWDTFKDYDKDGKSDWMEIVNIFKKHGYDWGGDWKFKDAPHFEKKGYNWRDLNAKYIAKDFIPGTTYVNI